MLTVTNLRQSAIDMRSDDIRLRLSLMPLKFIVVSSNTHCDQTVDKA